MVALFAYAMEEASANSRPWLVVGAVGLGLAVVLRALAKRRIVKDRARTLLMAATLVLAFSGLTVMIIGLTLHLPAAEGGDQFYPSLGNQPHGQ